MRRLVIPALIGGLCLLASLGLVRSCGWTEPVTFPDYADSLAELRIAHAATVGAWQAERRALAISRDSALQVAGTAKGEAARLRAIRLAAKHDTLIMRDSTSPAGFIRQGIYDTLAAEADSLWSVVRADSVALFVAQEWIHTDSIMYARLHALLRYERSLFAQERVALRQMVVKARRGCRVLGLLPCPILSAGYGATLTGGQVRTGPVVAVTIPVRF